LVIEDVLGLKEPFVAQRQAWQATLRQQPSNMGRIFSKNCARRWPESVLQSSRIDLLIG